VTVDLASLDPVTGRLCFTSSLACGTVQVGQTVEGFVNLSFTGATPNTQFVVSLRSSSPQALPVPPSVTINPATAQAGPAFTATAGVVGCITTATVTAFVQTSSGLVFGAGPGASINNLGIPLPNGACLPPGALPPPLPPPGQPGITSINPGSGSVGTPVTITGISLAGATRVTLDCSSLPAPFTVVSSTTVTATVPAGAATGTCGVTVTTPNGTASIGGIGVGGALPGSFTVTAGALPLPVAPPPPPPPPVAPPPPPPTPVTSSIVITRAELNQGQLRIEGSGATPLATLTVNGQALGAADGAGNFRLQTTGFSAPGCTATVSDGTGSVTTPLAGC